MQGQRHQCAARAALGVTEDALQQLTVMAACAAASCPRVGVLHGPTLADGADGPGPLQMKTIID
ncbi:hypothetical protein BJF85_21180 [Saccharomonospora sp. CUA-673]|nr:hypothetical protein BJF85_21180 [Saccharomonospora sp. CUA-673]